MVNPCRLPDPMDFDRKVKFRPRDYAVNAIGEVEVHSSIGSVQFSAWCKVRTRGSKEVYFARQQQDQVDVVLEAEYTSDLATITGDWQFLIGDEEFEMLGPPENVDYQNTLLRFTGRKTEGLQ